MVYIKSSSIFNMRLFLNNFRVVFFIYIIGFSLESNGQIDSILYPSISKVNVFQGTGGHGHTHPAATAPFGLVQAGPDTRTEGWDACSGYHYDDDTLLGFSQTHLSGTGIADLNDFLFQPFQSKPRKGKYPFRHQDEYAYPGYYSVKIPFHRMKVDIVATPRGAIYQINYTKSKKSFLLIDLMHRDGVNYSSVTKVNDTTLVLERLSTSWAKNQHAYLYVVFSQKIKDIHIQWKAKNIASGVLIKFAPTKTYYIKVGYSGTDKEGAALNYEAELKPFCFEELKTLNLNVWEKELSAFNVYGKENEVRTFYSCLYHCFILPSVWSDVNGRFRIDDRIYQDTGYVLYSLFSLWDTYRALHPLLVITHPHRTNDFISTFLSMYRHRKRLPVWELHGNETNCMIGAHSISVMTDAYVKGIGKGKGMDMLDAMTDEMFQRAKTYSPSSFITADQGQESVSKTLEHGYDDWCVARMAERLTGPSPLQFFHDRRAVGYRSLFNPQRKFMQARRNGKFLEPFDPAEVNHHFTEANSWQYTFHAPYDISAFAEMMGGERALENALDSLFATDSKLNGRQQPDITGLIGQYAHGNEPSHHIAYLYHVLGKPDKGNKIIQEILKTQYDHSPNGFSGNEDCGQMSAWYVWSSIGLYPWCPGNPEYMLALPIFDSVFWHLPNGKELKIYKHHADSGTFISSIKYQNHAFSSLAFPHLALAEGGTLTFTMGSQPMKWTNSFNKGNQMIGLQHSMAPWLDYSSHVFDDSLQIYIKGWYDEDENYFYRTNQSPWNFHPNKNIPITIYKSDTLTVRGQFSKHEVSGIFIQKPKKWQLKIESPVHPEYTGGGKEALLDGLYGAEDFHAPGWQSYHGIDFDGELDLGDTITINAIGFHCLQNPGSWIWYPEKIEIFTSVDGIEYTKTSTWTNDVSEHESAMGWLEIPNLKGSVRYIRFKAINRKMCPQWHPGKGEKAHIFVDEIRIR